VVIRDSILSFVGNYALFYFVYKKLFPEMFRSVLISCKAVRLKVGKVKINIVNMSIDKIMSAVLLRTHQSHVLCKLQHSSSL